MSSMPFNPTYFTARSSYAVFRDRIRNLAKIDIVMPE
jgi:hypothetical protein